MERLQSDVLSGGTKRKAEDQISEVKAKIAKKTSAEAMTLGRKSALPPVGPAANNVIAANFRGTAKQLQIPSRAQIPAGSNDTGDEAPKKQPKKGSYAEIMARAKSNQGAPQAVGTISHKPRDKMAMSYKKEMKLSKKAIKDRKLGIKRDRNHQPNSVSSTGPNSLGLPKPVRGTVQKPVPSAPVKPKVETSYKGTMHPVSTSIKAKPKESHRPQNRRRDEYAGTDEELDDKEDYYDEDEDDEGDGYGSESDDMEAGFDDVEEEEGAALKAARKEDEREAQLEARLKREKEEKKRKLAELAKKAKPQRY